jgi:hypothetical protein
MPSPIVLRLLLLLFLANGTPVMVKKLLGNRWSYPLDGDREFVDGKPLFGRSKTIRGVALAILSTTAGAALLDLGWRIGVLVGTLAMVGDLSSSFLKRRLGRPSSGRRAARRSGSIRYRSRYFRCSAASVRCH